MRIVFIGTVRFSLHSLERLMELNANVVGICTLRESKFNSDHIDLSDFGAIHQIQTHYSEDINSVKSVDWIKEQRPDVIFCFGWSRLLKKELLSLAPKGVIGFHPAALPSNRGRHPLIWALALGLNKTASTFFVMTEKADDGDIISQKEITITKQDDAASLYSKVTVAALKQIEELLPQLNDGRCLRIKQDKSVSNSWRKRGSLDGAIDWRMSANSIYNLVRALALPYVGAHFFYNKKQIKVWSTFIVENRSNNIEPGKVIGLSKRGPIVKCGDDAICIPNFDGSSDLNIGDYL